MLRRLKIAWLSLRAHLLPKWLRCEVIFTYDEETKVLLNEVEVPARRAQQCIEVAHQTRLRQGLFLQDVASVEFEVMSTGTTFAYLATIHELED